MKKCTDFEKMILEGLNSPELETHLRNCPECASLKKQVTQFRLPGTGDMVIPASIDNAIRAAARENLTQKHRGIPFPSHPVKIFLSAAACLLICCGIAIFSVSRQGGTQQTKADVVAVDSKAASELWSGNLENAVMDLAFDMEAGNEMQMLALADQSNSIFSGYDTF